MAIGNPYGAGPYGAGPYARYPETSGRPFGVGPYGVGLYSHWGGNTFDVAGASGLAFRVTARPVLVQQIHAATSITFGVLSSCPPLVMCPEAITEIVLSTQAELAWTWAVWPACETGTWQPAAPCESGAWTGAPAACSPGAWTPMRPP